jgi:2-haloacid dehalogenase
MAGDLFEKFEGVQACVFDAYGTLFNVASPIEKLSGSIGEQAPNVAKLWRQKQLEYSWLRSLMGVHADFWTVTRDALDHALEVYNITEPDLADELMTLYLKLDAYGEVAAALQAVRAKGKRCAVLSNGSPSMLDSALRNAGLEKLFEHVLSVEEVGIYKPSRRVYRLAMQKLQIADAPSICFISANSWDAQAAAQFGFQVAKVARGANFNDRIPGRPAAVIDNLSMLVELL